MKKIIIGLALLVSASVASEEIELVRNAEIVNIQSAIAGDPSVFVLQLKGGTGLCADKKVKVRYKKTFSDMLFKMNYATALAAFTSQLKTVSLGSVLGKEDCDQITYIKLTR